MKEPGKKKDSVQKASFSFRFAAMRESELAVGASSVSKLKEPSENWKREGAVNSSRINLDARTCYEHGAPLWNKWL